MTIDPASLPVPNSNTTHRGNSFEIEVKLTELASSKELDLDVEEGDIIVAAPGYAEIRVPLPAYADEDALTCKFDVATRTLLLKVPVNDTRGESTGLFDDTSKTDHISPEYARSFLDELAGIPPLKTVASKEASAQKQVETGATSINVDKQVLADAEAVNLHYGGSFLDELAGIPPQKVVATQEVNNSVDKAGADVEAEWERKAEAERIAAQIVIEEKAKAAAEAESREFIRMRAAEDAKARAAEDAKATAKAERVQHEEAQQARLAQEREAKAEATRTAAKRAEIQKAAAKRAELEKTTAKKAEAKKAAAKKVEVEKAATKRAEVEKAVQEARSRQAAKEKTGKKPKNKARKKAVTNVLPDPNGDGMVIEEIVDEERSHSH